MKSNLSSAAPPQICVMTTATSGDNIGIMTTVRQRLQSDDFGKMAQYTKTYEQEAVINGMNK